MRFGIDIDETITRAPEVFRTLAAALMAAGHEVIIITVRDDRADTERFLAELDMPYSQLVTATLDEHLEHGVDPWKGVVCQRLGIALMIDDSPAVLRHLPPSTLPLLVATGNGR